MLVRLTGTGSFRMTTSFPNNDKKKIEAGEYLIAKMASEPVGCLRFSYFWSIIPFIELIWVVDHFQRRGIGRADVGALVDLRPLQSVTEIFFAKNIGS
jgi:hypothetical protein